MKESDVLLKIKNKMKQVKQQEDEKKDPSKT
jgi:hypothetical protein